MKNYLIQKKLIEALERVSNKKVKLVENTLLQEAKDYTSDLVDLINSSPGLSFTEILNELGIVPKSAGQIAVFSSLKKALADGKLSREAAGRSFKYFPGTGQSVQTKTLVKKPKITRESILADLRTLGYRNLDEDTVYESNHSFSVDVSTGQRGPRTDHGGGPDGDGWMDYHQVEKLRQSYIKTNQNLLKRTKDYFKKKGIKIEPDIDYGEKGHVSVTFEIQK